MQRRREPIAASFLWVSLVVPVVASLAGCAHVVVDPDGTRHVTGLLMLTLPAAPADVGADVVRMRSFGVTLTHGNAAGAQFTLGYSDTTFAAIRNDSLVSRTALRRAVRDELPLED